MGGRYMPISSNEWEKGRTHDSTYNRILTFLQSNKNNAFTLKEIIEEIDPLIPDSTIESANLLEFYIKWTSIDKALQKLMNDGKVKAKKVEKGKIIQVHYIAV